MAEPESSSSPRNNPSVPEQQQQPLRSLLDDLRPHSTTPSLPSSLPSPSPLLPLHSSTGTAEKRLHVSNIPFKWREADLFRIFSPHGETRQIDIVTNERGSKGFGFVTFTDGQAADRAVAALNQCVFEGRTITVNEATRRRKPLEERPPPMRGGDPARTAQQAPSGSACSSDFGALLLKQKQFLAQQQLQQFIATQQQSNLIAVALGLPPPSLGDFMAGQLPAYAAMPGMPGLGIDPLALQMLQLQSQPSLPLLQQSLHSSAAAAAAFHAQQQHAAYGQMPTVSAGYPIPQMFPADGVKTEMGVMPTLNQMLMANELAGSSSLIGKGRSKNDVATQRFTPY